MTYGIGHNSGREMRAHPGRVRQWRQARRALLGAALPVEVVRLRVRRAAALGLDYRTYAGIRATTGRDVIALLFSANALGMIRRAEIDATRAAKLAEVDAVRGALVHAPLPAAAPPPLDWAERAPDFAQSPAALRRHLRAVLRDRRLPADAVLMIGATGFEREWCAAIRAAGYLDATGYFTDETEDRP